MGTSYVDYSIFQEDKFDARQYANSLLLSTTDRDELLIDFSSAENKVKFDLEEVEAATRNTIESNWEDLLDRTEIAASCTVDVAAIEKELKTCREAYETMAAKALVPYEEAEPLYDSLVNLASTTSMLRSLKRYLNHLTSLDEVKDITSSTRVLVDLDRCVRENQALMHLRIVLSNLPRVDSRKALVIQECTSCVSGYRNVGPALSAMNQLDHKGMMNLLKTNITKSLSDASRVFKTGLEVTASIRKLQVTDNTRAVGVFVENLQQAFRGLGSLATQLQTLEDDCPPDLVQQILEELCDASASMKQYFWREVSGRISSITRDAIRGNQWIQRSLRAANTESIVSQGVQKGTMEFSVVHGSLSRK
ncbi:protein of unknown function [Taphrina deformans PYCC 5710]|uniref:Conserved oligomeric Golgi complex subunit 5 n=1 Tax=Taphrina deformans (strain PYCC 5710 / ATCC 11124 / CBS 356.35 / IMI 108563 / JCM 9778 / NBRC 8474) TaxID=1097556 RepID=R4XH83_TAPDE|nr:protein of unknown function [Taphrina deformans PYCC 5710]|eukprot:CCG85053.2 protein of unknown function [Taphrina deformans PYCC 5710]